MTTLADCEIAIRGRVHEWVAEISQDGEEAIPFFSDYLRWLREKGHVEELIYLEEVRELGAAKAWFEEELRQ